MCAVMVNVQQGKIRVVHTVLKEREKLLNIDRSGTLFGKRGEGEDVCFLTSNQLIFDPWSWATHCYYLFLVNAILR